MLPPAQPPCPEEGGLNLAVSNTEGSKGSAPLERASHCHFQHLLKSRAGLISQAGEKVKQAGRQAVGPTLQRSVRIFRLDKQRRIQNGDPTETGLQ